MFKRLIIIALLAYFCAPAMSAVSKSSALPITLNLGSHTEFFGAVQNDSSGGLRKWDFAPTVGIGTRLNISSPEFTFLPEFNWVLPRGAGSSKIIKNLFMFRADLGYNPVDWFRLRIGTSLMLANQYGQGGSTTMNNGNSSSKFYYPDENRSSWNNTFDLGVEVLPLFFERPQNWSLRLQTYTYSIFREDRRQISYSVFWTYTWNNK